MPEDEYEIKYTIANKVLEESDGIGQINQYKLQSYLGEGGSGKVYLAKDIISGTQYAVKKIYKRTLRKEDQMLLMKEEKERRNSENKILIKPAMPIQIGDIVKKQKISETQDQFYLIRHELAIHKKLRHPNVVMLYEVIDDPEDDSISMVFDYCEKGPLFGSDLEDSFTLIGENKSRYFFNQAMLGLEYRNFIKLHYQPPLIYFFINVTL
ncbi:Serine/threonine-protein kinase ppk34 [Smittium mucronatum]|uniref:Serine/threonine-protein kinase ppk34 n=1 Tax=Smittium mucronatum TaxID=133383 RepID=A0A1R0H1U8_9FUNG|nr:Serine/threonine-protein kinase ppk34 [Smittium mucronatum]